MTANEKIEQLEKELTLVKETQAGFQSDIRSQLRISLAREEHHHENQSKKKKNDIIDTAKEILVLAIESLQLSNKSKSFSSLFYYHSLGSLDHIFILYLEESSSEDSSSEEEAPTKPAVKKATPTKAAPAKKAAKKESSSSEDSEEEAPAKKAATPKKAAAKKEESSSSSEEVESWDTSSEELENGKTQLKTNVQGKTTQTKPPKSAAIENKSMTKMKEPSEDSSSSDDEMIKMIKAKRQNSRAGSVHGSVQSVKHDSSDSGSDSDQFR